MQIRAVNRNNGRTIIAKLRDRAKIQLKKKPSVPGKDARKVA